MQSDTEPNSERLLMELRKLIYDLRKSQDRRTIDWPPREREAALEILKNIANFYACDIRNVPQESLEEFEQLRKLCQPDPKETMSLEITNLYYRLAYL